MDGLATLYVFDDLGLLVELIANVVDIAALVHHRPLVLSDVVGQFRICLAAGIPALDVGVVVTHVTFPGRKADALHRLVEKVFSGLWILDKVHNGIEVSVEHKRWRTSFDGNLESSLARTFPRRFEMDEIRVR